MSTLPLLVLVVVGTLEVEAIKAAFAATLPSMLMPWMGSTEVEKGPVSAPPALDVSVVFRQSSVRQRSATPGGQLQWPMPKCSRGEQRGQKEEDSATITFNCTKKLVTV